jgi:hypothetical protein
MFDLFKLTETRLNDGFSNQVNQTFRVECRSSDDFLLEIISEAGENFPKESSSIQ